MEQNKSMIAAVIAVIVLLGGGIGIYLLTQDSDETANEPTTSQTTPTGTRDTATTAEEETGDTIVELAVATDSLSTLVKAVTAAELVDTLSGTGPFTVFAPTNDAFAALPEGTLDELLVPGNQPQLQAVLTYHVVASKVMSSDLSDGQEITTVQGGTLTVRIQDGKVMLEDATGGMAEIVTADIEASNGVVHVINKVVLAE